MHARLGVEFTERPDTLGKREPVREIRGFPLDVLAHFTRRRADLKAEYEVLVREYRAAHGRDPPLAAAHELAQQATLATRKGKKPPRAWAAMREDWRASLGEQFGPDGLARVLAVVPDRAGRSVSQRVRIADLDVPELAGRVVVAVQEQHATWTRWSVLAQVQRELRGVRFVDRTEQERAVESIVEASRGRPRCLAAPMNASRSTASCP